MEGLALLDRARRAGLVVHLDGDALVVRGPKRLEGLAREMLAHKAAVAAVLRHQIATRTIAMRKQLADALSAGRPIPFLTVGPASATPSPCLSCGDPIPRPNGIRCTPCAQAARAVINTAVMSTAVISTMGSEVVRS